MMRLLVAAQMFTLSVAVQAAVSQTPLSFFPHHQGDVWEYVDPNDTTFYEHNIITNDSLGGDGRFYITTTLFGKNILDTVAAYVLRTYNSIDTLLWYRLNADSGDTWTVFQNSIFRSSARVAAVSEGIVFGQISTIKRIDFYTYRLGDPDSLLGETDYLASGFGLIGQDFDTFPFRRIRGAIIDSVRYGTITSVNEQIAEPVDFTLYQNYPNPFNPETTIRFYLISGARVRLTVFTLLGQRVQDLLDNYRNAGVHSIMFNSQGLASGVYLYRLTVGSTSHCRKMVVAR